MNPTAKELLPNVVVGLTRKPSSTSNHLKQIELLYQGKSLED